MNNNYAHRYGYYNLQYYDDYDCSILCVANYNTSRREEVLASIYIAISYKQGVAF